MTKRVLKMAIALLAMMFVVISATSCKEVVPTPTVNTSQNSCESGGCDWDWWGCKARQFGTMANGTTPGWLTAKSFEIMVNDGPCIIREVRVRVYFRTKSGDPDLSIYGPGPAMSSDQQSAFWSWSSSDDFRTRWIMVDLCRKSPTTKIFYCRDLKMPGSNGYVDTRT